MSDLQTEPVSGLAYRLRTPTPAKPSKLLVLLHGVGSNETNLLTLATGIDADTLVVFGQGPLQMGPQQYAWFRVMFTPSGPQIVPQEAEHSRQLLITLLLQLQQQHGIAPANSVIAGFSQGGIMSASVALSSPESVRGFAILSGRILPELEPQIASNARLATLRAFVGHGDYDSKLPVHWAERSDALLKARGVIPESHRYPIDHGISAEMHADFVRWLAG
ncbi:phospholipase [Rhodoferax sp. GW822-FHT02A01]|uniref:alpha/beta hydrolase n=1 Tax=Rhodoferax sp. GW822-FHT02A01 TaxID=3141537 RepID=UPI00315C4EA0